MSDCRMHQIVNEGGYWECAHCCDRFQPTDQLDRLQAVNADLARKLADTEDHLGCILKDREALQNEKGQWRSINTDLLTELKAGLSIARRAIRPDPKNGLHDLALWTEAARFVIKVAEQRS